MIATLDRCPVSSRRLVVALAAILLKGGLPDESRAERGPPGGLEREGPGRRPIARRQAERDPCAGALAAPQTFSFGETPRDRLHYEAEAYPWLLRRVEGFADRLNSPVEKERYRLQHEVGNLLPHAEAEALLRKLMKDPSPAVSDQATAQLLGWGYPVRTGEAPTSHHGVDPQNAVDFKSKLTAIRQCLDATTPEPDGDVDLGAGADSGPALQVLGLYGDASDLPRIARFARHKNSYVRLCAAGALLSRGDDGTSARACFVPDQDQSSPFYEAHFLFLIEYASRTDGWDPVTAWVTIYRQLYDRNSERRAQFAFFGLGTPEQVAAQYR